MFFRKPKAKPTVKTEWSELVFDPKYKQWTLSYQGIEFYFRGSELKLPERSRLDSYIEWVGAHRDHIDRQIKELVGSSTDVYIDVSKAHISMIEVESENRIGVIILGDETWGDIGYDLAIEDGVIVNEGFVD